MSSAKQHNIDRFCSYIEYFRFIHRGLSRDQNVILKKVVCFPSHNIENKANTSIFQKKSYSKLHENSIVVCYVGGAKVILISHIAAKQQSLVSFSRKREETDGEEYRRRISKRGGGREDCAAVIEELLEGTPIVDVIFVLLCLKSYCSIWNLLKKVGSLASS